MNKITVWDLPIRVFHWVFSISLSMALIIAFFVDDDSSLFPYHMLFGLTAGFLLVIRVVIGLFGARYSRFRGLMFPPGETIAYMMKSLMGGARRYVGHNPGTAAVALIMFGLAIGLVWTGLTMTSDASEELHGVLAYMMVAAIVAHLLGMLLHTLHHRENVMMSMVSGKKDGEMIAALPSSQRLAGVLTLLVCSLWIAALFRGYDAANAVVTIPGIGAVSLGEGESKQEHEGSHEDGNEVEDDD